MWKRLLGWCGLGWLVESRRQTALRNQWSMYDLKCVIDDGYTVVVYKTLQGYYRAMALCPQETPTFPVITGTRIVDDDLPGIAIGRLAEKIYRDISHNG